MSCMGCESVRQRRTLADLKPATLNQLLEQINKLLQITRAVRSRTEQLKEAG